jgi:hypothetical protein
MRCRGALLGLVAKRLRAPISRVIVHRACALERLAVPRRNLFVAQAMVANRRDHGAPLFALVIASVPAPFASSAFSVFLSPISPI